MKRLKRLNEIAQNVLEQTVESLERVLETLPCLVKCSYACGIEKPQCGPLRTMTCHTNEVFDSGQGGAMRGIGAKHKSLSRELLLKLKAANNVVVQVN